MKRYIPTYESFIGLNNKFVDDLRKVSKRVNYPINIDDIKDTNINTDIFYVYNDNDTKFLHVYLNKTAKSIIDKKFIGKEYDGILFMNAKEYYDDNDKQVSSRIFLADDIFITACDIINKVVTLSLLDRKDNKKYKALLGGFDLTEIDNSVKPTSIKVGKVLRELLQKSNHAIDDKVLTKLTEFLDFESKDYSNHSFKVLTGNEIFDAYDTNKVVPTSSLGDSCMMDKINENTVPFTDVLALYDNTSGLIISRAYMWRIADESPLNYEYLIDRIYSSSDHTRRIMENYIIEKGYLYRTHQLRVGEWDIVDLAKHDKINKNDVIVKANIDPSFSDLNMLYIDTFLYMNVKEQLFSITKNKFAYTRIPPYDLSDNYIDIDYLGLNILLNYDVYNFEKYYKYCTYELNNDRKIVVTASNDVFEYFGEVLIDKDLDKYPYMPEIITYDHNSYNSDYLDIEIKGKVISRDIILEIDTSIEYAFKVIPLSLSKYEEKIYEMDLLEDTKNYLINLKKMYDYNIKNNLSIFEFDDVNIEHTFKNSKGEITWYPLS